MIVEQAKHTASGDNDDIPRDDEHRIPDREFIGPLGHAQGNDGSQHQPLVGNGIEDCSQARLEMKTARNPSIDAITERGCDKNPYRGQAKRLVGMPRGGRPAIIDGKNDKDRNQQNPAYRDLIGKSHSYPTFCGRGKSGKLKVNC